jgi:hypothetical protein
MVINQICGVLKNQAPKFRFPQYVQWGSEKLTSPVFKLAVLPWNWVSDNPDKMNRSTIEMVKPGKIFCFFEWLKQDGC